MRATPMVALAGVEKAYRLGETVVHALHHVNLEIGRGEMVVILGPSGCGKSTLLNIIGGLDTPTAGTVEVAGHTVSQLDDEGLTRFRRESVGFIFQFFNLVATLSARENVELAAELAHDPLPVDEVLEAVGLTSRGDHFPSELSGGEQQRVAIARALVKRPAVLLCDEPTGELDAETGRRVLQVLHDVTHTRQQTVLMVTHNAAIGQIGDRVLRLASGTIVSDERVENPVAVEAIEW